MAVAILFASGNFPHRCDDFWPAEHLQSTSTDVLGCCSSPDTFLMTTASELADGEPRLNLIRLISETLAGTVKNSFADIWLVTEPTGLGRQTLYVHLPVVLTWPQPRRLRFLPASALRGDENEHSPEFCGVRPRKVAQPENEELRDMASAYDRRYPCIREVIESVSRRRRRRRRRA